MIGPLRRHRLVIFATLASLAHAAALAAGPGTAASSSAVAFSAVAFSFAAPAPEFALADGAPRAPAGPNAAFNPLLDSVLSGVATSPAASLAAHDSSVPPASTGASDAPATSDMRAGEPVLGVPVPAQTAGEAAADAPAPVYPDLWGRIRAGFKMPELTNKRAQQSTRWYAGRPDYIARMTTRANLYLYHIVDEIEKRGMPTELALLPFVESAMQPEAVSWAKAAGLWQFIPATGKVYSLEQNLWKDERFGVIESTRAALDYLQKLHDEFGDWQLALAAYNYGEAGVERALARARAAHRSTAYSDLRLPTETQFYLPKLQAIKNIVAEPARYGIELPEIANEPYFVAFNKLLDIDVLTAAKLADMSIEDFRALNPAFNRPVILGASSPTLLVPADKADTFEANLAAWQATGQPLASWTAYTLQSGETVAKVAERVGLTEAQLRVANHIPPRYRPASGSTLLIPRDENMSGDIAPDFVQASFALVPDGANLRQVTYRVRRGDTLAAVARRWNVSADDIASWNNLNTMTLFTGQRLNLTVARPATPAVHHAVATKKKSAKPAVQPAMQPVIQTGVPSGIQSGIHPAVATGSGATPAASSPNTSRM